MKTTKKSLTLKKKSLGELNKTSSKLILGGKNITAGNIANTTVVQDDPVL